MKKNIFKSFKKSASLIIMLSMMLSFFPALPASANRIDGNTSFEGISSKAGATTNYIVYNNQDTYNNIRVTVYDGIDLSVAKVTYNTVSGGTYDAEFFKDSVAGGTYLDIVANNSQAEYTLQNVKNPTTASVTYTTYVQFEGAFPKEFPVTTIASEPAKLFVTPASSTVVAGFNDAIAVNAYDVYNNLTTTANNVYLSDRNGVNAVVSNSTYNYVNTKTGNYTLTATSDGLTSATTTISVTPDIFANYNLSLSNTATLGSLAENEIGKLTIQAQDQYKNNTTTNSVAYLTYNPTDFKYLTFYSDSSAVTVLPNNSIKVGLNGLATVYVKGLRKTGDTKTPITVNVYDNSNFITPKGFLPVTIIAPIITDNSGSHHSGGGSSTITPVIPATPATPAEPGITPAIPATPASPASIAAKLATTKVTMLQSKQLKSINVALGKNKIPSVNNITITVGNSKVFIPKLLVTSAKVVVIMPLTSTKLDAKAVNYKISLIKNYLALKGIKNIPIRYVFLNTNPKLKVSVKTGSYFSVATPKTLIKAISSAKANKTVVANKIKIMQAFKIK